MRRTLSSPSLRFLALLVPLAAVIALNGAPAHASAPAHRADGPPGCCGGKLP
jgi:hypothetical protein